MSSAPTRVQKKQEWLSDLYNAMRRSLDDGPLTGNLTERTGDVVSRTLVSLVDVTVEQSLKTLKRQNRAEVREKTQLHRDIRLLEEKNQRSSKKIRQLEKRQKAQYKKGGTNNKSEIPTGTYEAKETATVPPINNVVVENETKKDEEEPEVEKPVPAPRTSSSPPSECEKETSSSESESSSEEEESSEQEPELNDIQEEVEEKESSSESEQERVEEDNTEDSIVEKEEEVPVMEAPPSPVISRHPSTSSSRSSSDDPSSSSSETDEERKSDDIAIEIDPEAEKEPSNSEIEKPKDVVIPVESPPTSLERVSSSSSRVRSIDVGGGITLSLRIQRGSDTGPKVILNGRSLGDDGECTSSEDGSDEPLRSFSHHQTPDDGIKVIRRYDVPEENSGSYFDAPPKHIGFRPSSLPSDNESEELVTSDEAVAGVINVTSGEKLTICQATKKGLIPKKTALFLLEAQAATGSVVNPRNGVKLSVQGAIDLGLVDEHYRQTLIAAEGAYYGYLDPRTDETVCLSEAMRRGIFPKAQGMRLLEAQVATGGVIDPWTGARYALDAAQQKGLVDGEMVEALKTPDELMDFFDPGTQSKLSYGDLLAKCIRDLDTGLRFLYIEEKPRVVNTHYQPDLLTFRSAFRRKVTLQELIDAGLVERPILDAFRDGRLSKEELRDVLQPFLVGEEPIAGVLNKATHKVLSICQAVKNGLLRKGTALELLEAQAATGSIIDPASGKKMSVNRAVSIGLVDQEFAAALQSAEQAVHGFTEPGTNRLISLFEAMKKGIVIEIHGVRMLEAQLATGGVIDPEAGYRIPTSLALERGLFDYRMADILTTSKADLKGYYDPTSGENTTYAELMKRCVKNKKRHGGGMRLLPVIDRAPTTDLKLKGTFRHRKIIITDPLTNRQMSLDQAASANVIDPETLQTLSLQEGVWPDDGRRS